MRGMKATLKHICFDLDKTLTASRSPMEPAHQETFDRLCAQKDVVVVTGGTLAQIREQITPRFDGRYIALAQSGNQAVDANGEELWYEPLTDEQIRVIDASIETLKKHFDLRVRDEGDLVENRGALISYSVIGFHEAIDKKYAFDPGDARRSAALAALPEEVRKLRDAGIEVVPAGTTTYSFYAYGKHKGHNVARLIEKKGWKEEECLYIGDALFPGGNDETVIGVIPTYAVQNPEETFRYIEENLVS